MLSETQQNPAGEEWASAAKRPPETLRRLNEKIAFQQSRRKPRSSLAGRQPTACPDCETSWVGMSRRGACPTCGFAYDENTRSWAGRRRARLGTPILISVVAVTLGVMYFRIPWVIVPIAVLLPLFLGRTIYDLLVTRDGRFIATTPAGVMYRIGSHKTRTIAWDRVLLVEATAYKMPVFKVHHKTGAKRIRVDRAIRTCRDGCEFAVAVEDGVKRYGGSSAGGQCDL